MDFASVVLAAGVVGGLIYIGQSFADTHTHKDLLNDMASNSFDIADQKSDSQIYLQQDTEPKGQAVTPVESQVRELLRIEEQFYKQPPVNSGPDGVYVEFGKFYDPEYTDS
jgi:hypothetical protein